MNKENLDRYIKIKINQLLESEFSFKTLFELIHDQGDRVFSECYSSIQIKEVTYKDFKKYIFKFATYLSKFINLEKDNYIGIYLDNSINWIASFWAILMLGYRPLLINTRLPNDINKNVLEMVNCKLILSDESNLDLGVNLINIPKSNLLLKEVLNEEEYAPSEWGDKIALSTTATTLNVKVCVYTGFNFCYQILNAKGIVKNNQLIKSTYEGKMKLLMFLPLFHIFGLVASYFWFAFFGRTFVFLSDYSPNTILLTIRRHKVTHLFAVPLLWDTLAKEIKKEVLKQDIKTQKQFAKGLKISFKLQKMFPKLGLKIASKLFKRIREKTFGESMKFMISGGSYLSMDTLKTLNAIGYPLHVGYGATEIGITSVELRENIKYRILNSIGKPFEHVNYVVDDGVLKVRSLSMAEQIISKDSLKTYKDEYYYTSDLVSVDKNKSWYILGRQDDVFIGVNGEKINPDVIEKDINLIEVDKYCILDIPIDNVPHLSLVVEIAKNINPIKTKRVIEEINTLVKILKDKQYPITNVYYTYDAICNKNAIKVSRKALTRMLENKMVKLDDFSNLKVNEDVIEIDTSISLALKKIVARVLDIDIDIINNNSNFVFDLGGTSLDYATLIVEIEKEFDIKPDIPSGGIFEINELIKLINSHINGGKE